MQAATRRGTAAVLSVSAVQMRRLQAAGKTGEEAGREEVGLDVSRASHDSSDHMFGSSPFPAKTPAKQVVCVCVFVCVWTDT